MPTATQQFHTTDSCSAHAQTADEPSKTTPPTFTPVTPWSSYLHPPSLVTTALHALTTNALVSPLRSLWTVACILLHTVLAPGAQHQPPEHPPDYSPGLQYGFLQGTFGLPYGGYLVRPPAALPSTLLLTQKVPMFSVIGRRDEICALLRSMHTMVFSHMAARTYTADIVIEVYPVDRTAWRMPRWLDFTSRTPRQLVIRAGRTFVPADFDPLLAVRAPQGISMREIADVLARCWDQRAVDLTRDKALNISLMGRSRSMQLADHEHLDELHGFATDDSFSLPPYHHHAHQNYQHISGSSSEPPPSYSQLHDK
ncbi:hypothetical protein LPJ73_002651 [Coemansia sp. RSA 2703]|nr:hypothetical protein LPJ73_002651 [Coemansia sp. RSA 2703]KAJ2368149.1 hypothetical protein IW150_005485 [Coemansia sp. RSA 2607]KAJ2390002.1 hypothetical protein GGI05_003340 [Coemansia sp. RSA 2603]